MLEMTVFSVKFKVLLWYAADAFRENILIHQKLEINASLACKIAKYVIIRRLALHAKKHSISALIDNRVKHAMQP